MAALRVLHIVTAFPRHEGDVITPWLVEMLRRLRARGVEAEVYAPSYQGLGDQVLWGIPVHRFRYFPGRWENLTHDEITIDRMTRSLFFKILPGFYLLGGMAGIVKLCLREKYDVIHVHWPLPHAVFGWLAARICRARLVSTFYGAELRWVKHSLPFLKWFISWAARISDRVVAISTYTAGEIRSIADVPVEVIPYTIGFPENPKPETRNPKPEIPEILTVGRLVERKGVRYLVDAMRLLPESLNARLVVVGGGPLLGELKSHARAIGVERRVVFTGKISENELIDHYRRAAVYVQPAVIDSRGDTEMLGVVLLEAIYQGVPVIGSNVGGIPDVIIDGTTGLLVPEKDPKALADTIEKVIIDKQLKEKLIKNATSYVTVNFNWDKIIETWIKVYS